MDKIERLQNMFTKVGQCSLCTDTKDSRSLINFYQDPKFYFNIPSIWTDWLDRSNARIMIVGQDWGPYIDMCKSHNRYADYIGDGHNELWKKIVREPESMTNRMMTKYIIESASHYNIQIDTSIMDCIYVTNAVLCARQGSNYRGNDNFAPKKHTENCTSFLLEQIRTIQPLAVVLLGYWPLYSICKAVGKPVYKTLKEMLSSYNSPTSLIQIDETYIIPVYHPAAQISKDEQLKYYDMLWLKLLEIYNGNIQQLLIELNFTEAKNDPNGEEYIQLSIDEVLGK